MNSRSPAHHYSDAEEEDSPLQQSVQGDHPGMADLDPEDNMSEAEEEIAGANPDDPAADGEVEEEEAEDEEEQILTSKLWRARALSLLKLSRDGGLTSRPQCLFLTLPRS
jgi:hypothetical protein